MSDERRRELGIPVHSSEEDHEWRRDGYCNCGASNFKANKPPRIAKGTYGKINIDVIEGNPTSF
ncbi:MAG TPA: hypothetical protein VIY48_11735 [Candidatus Paceibacterota bacterium]